MKPLTESVERVSIKAGLFTCAALVIYFITMKLFGLEKMFDFRFLNFLILSGGVCYAIRKTIKYELSNNDDDFYLKGFAAGIFTSLVAVFSFSFFISAYLAYIDNGLMKYIQSTVSYGEYVTGLTIFLILSLEGIASSVIVVFCAMQYFKSKITSHASEKASHAANHHAA